MSNPTSVVTERRLGEFYQEILPYLGGSADAGFTPVGSVIAIMGVTAPANYLACNGQIVNVADYPELANYFEQQFGTKYKFGGSGTTFGIPDLRGEFLRGTGTNSHTNQGSGADVGVHQNGTLQSAYSAQISSSKVRVKALANTSGEQWTTDFDKIYKGVGTSGGYVDLGGTWSGSEAEIYKGTTRPTNTSILWCIATKDIYLNPSMDYSTSEKVVGKWVDGKTIYQKTFTGTTSTVADNIAHNIANFDKAISCEGYVIVSEGNNTAIPVGFYNGAQYVSCFTNSTQLCLRVHTDYLNKGYVITLRYTKTN